MKKNHIFSVVCVYLLGHNIKKNCLHNNFNIYNAQEMFHTAIYPN